MLPFASLTLISEVGKLEIRLIEGLRSQVKEAPLSTRLYQVWNENTVHRALHFLSSEAESCFLSSLETQGTVFPAFSFLTFMITGNSANVPVRQKFREGLITMP